MITLTFYLKGTSSLFVAVSCFLSFLFSNVFLRTSENTYWWTGRESISTCIFHVPAAHPILCVVTNKSLLHTDQSAFEKKNQGDSKATDSENGRKLSPRSYTHQTLSPQLAVPFTRRYKNLDSHHQDLKCLDFIKRWNFLGHQFRTHGCARLPDVSLKVEVETRLNSKRVERVHGDTTALCTLQVPPYSIILGKWSL